MTRKSITITAELQDYLVAHSAPLDEIAQDLIAETERLFPNNVSLQIAPEQAGFLTFLVRLLNVGHAVEVGTFTGFSSLAIARGLRPGGHLLCCDINEEWTSVARRYWERAGVSDRVELRIGPALETLQALPTEPYLDFAFIDADKTGYPAYWGELVPRMRPGGVIVVDNVLRHGAVVEPGPHDPSTEAIIAFNEQVLADDRVESVMLPIADGLTLARRL